MIWPKVPGTPLTGYNGEAAATVVQRGTFMYIAGEFEAAAAAPGTPGNASLGSLRMLIAEGDYIASGNGCFPVDKLIYQLEGADQDLDTIASGAGMIYYNQGEYETDQYNGTCSGTGVRTGDQLWIDDNGLLTTTARDAHIRPVAWLKDISEFPSTRKWFTGGNTASPDVFKKTLWYALHNYHDGPMGFQIA
jgi:hypothetical protein